MRSTDNCLSAWLVLQYSFIAIEMFQGLAGQALQPQGFTAQKAALISPAGSGEAQRAAIWISPCTWGFDSWIRLPESESQSTVIQYQKEKIRWVRKSVHVHYFDFKTLGC